MKELEKGFYYHYKHNPEGEVNNYAYEVLSTGVHTETKEIFVVYRSLYTSTDGKGGNANYWLRPYDMFIENVVKDGQEIPRFTFITDERAISELKKIKERMYREMI